MKNVENYPVGLGADINAERQTLPTTEVKNKVALVNPAFKGRVPFRLIEEEPAKIGLFLNPKGVDGDFEIDYQTENLSGRTVTLGRVAFEDNNGNRYRDVLVKGIGHHRKIPKKEPDRPEFSVTHSVAPLREASTNLGTRGICDYKEAVDDWDKAEEFYKLGIRVPRPIAIIRLHELVDEEGQKISIDAAKKEHLINNLEEPVLYLRAFGVQTRFGGFISTALSHRFTYLNDARVFMSQELGVDEKSFNFDAYLTWLAETQAKNIALLHKNGYAHKNLSNDHNLTLDGRIVDFDTATKETNTYNIQKEFSFSYDSFHRFLKSIFEIEEVTETLDYTKYLKKFSQVYDEIVGESELKLNKAT